MWDINTHVNTVCKSCFKETLPETNIIFATRALLRTCFSVRAMWVSERVAICWKSDMLYSYHPSFVTFAHRIRPTLPETLASEKVWTWKWKMCLLSKKITGDGHVSFRECNHWKDALSVKSCELTSVQSPCVGYGSFLEEFRRKPFWNVFMMLMLGYKTSFSPNMCIYILI